MKTTDSVMREKAQIMADLAEVISSNDKLMNKMIAVNLAFEALYSHSLARREPPEIKTELPFEVTINGVPHTLTSISEQNFASLLRVGGPKPDGKITLTFTKSDLLTGDNPEEAK